MEGKQHGDVVSAIKAGGDEAKLLVVDKETDEFFKKCKVTPSQEHLDGEFTVGCLAKAWPEMGEEFLDCSFSFPTASPTPGLVDRG